jgi:hypothetical protein
MSPAGPPPPVTERQRRDLATAKKLEPHLAKLLTAFAAQNPDAAHPIMICLVHFAAVTAKQCGMRSAEEFGAFCKLCFGDLKS